MAKPVIAVGCLGGSNSGENKSFRPQIQKFDSSGIPYRHGHRVQLSYGIRGVLGIALDSIGNIYAAGPITYYNNTQSQEAYGEDAYTTFKLNPDGYILWAATHGAIVFSLTIDSSGNVYTFGDAVNNSGLVRTSPSQTTGFYTTRKYNNNGVLQWSSDHGYAQSYYNTGNGYSKPIQYKNGYIYTGTQSRVVKTNATNGAIVWVANEISGESANEVRGLVVDSSDNVYIAGIFGENSVNGYILRKFNSSGTLIAQARAPYTDWPTSQALALAIDSSNNLIVGINRSVIGDYYLNNHKPIAKYDSNLGYLGQDIGLGGPATSVVTVSTDTDDNIYFAQNYSTSAVPRNLIKLNSSLVKQWEVSTYGQTEEDINGNVTYVYSSNVSEVETPPLKMPIFLGKPIVSGDTYIISPGLPIRIGVAAPTIVREYLAEPLPTRYRFYISGTPNLEVAIESFQVRANLEEQSLSVVIPMPSTAIIPELEARLGNYLILDRGVLFRSGIEQLDTMISVVFDSMRYDVGTANSSATLSGSSTPVTGTNKTRTLRGISYRNEQNGIRRVRSAVDTYLQPGDTVNLGGGETMIVAEITISVDINTATMEISE